MTKRNLTDLAGKQGAHELPTTVCLRVPRKILNGFLSGRIRPRQGTGICNFGAPSPLDFLNLLQWIFPFLCKLERKWPRNVRKLPDFCFFLSPIPFFHKNLGGGGGSRGKTPCFFWWFPCMLQKKQGKEDEGLEREELGPWRLGRGLWKSFCPLNSAQVLSPLLHLFCFPGVCEDWCCGK